MWPDIRTLFLFIGNDVEFARVHFTRTLDPLTPDAFTALLPNHTITSEPFETSSFMVLGSASCVISSQGSIMTLRETAASGNLRHQLERIPYATEEIQVVIHNSVPTDLRLREIGSVPLGRRVNIKAESSCTASQKTSMEAAFKRAGQLAAFARDQIRQNKNPGRLVQPSYWDTLMCLLFRADRWCFHRIWAYWLQDSPKVLSSIASHYEMLRIYSAKSLDHYKNGTKVHYTCKDEWKYCTYVIARISTSNAGSRTLQCELTYH